MDQLRSQLEERERHLHARAVQVQEAQDEVRRLASAFDGMVSRLQLDQDALGEQRREAEGKVGAAAFVDAHLITPGVCVSTQA